MLRANYFFSIFLVTVIITRIGLYIKPLASPTIKGLRLHHYMYGFLILIISLFFKNPLGFSLGLGLFIDEIPYLVLKGKTHKDNYSKNSIRGVVILIILIWILRRKIFFL